MTIFITQADQRLVQSLMEILIKDFAVVMGELLPLYFKSFVSKGRSHISEVEVEFS